MSHSAIRPTVLNSGLIGSIFCYQIKPTDKATPTASANGGIDVVNQAHTDISNVYILLNAHHNNNLQHIGDFQINGNVQVNGATTDFEVSAMQLHDKLVYLNYLGTSATAEGAGLTITSSAGNISALTFWSSANQKWQIDASLDVAVFDSDGTLSVWPTGGNDLALPPLSAVQGLASITGSTAERIYIITGAISETATGAFQATIEQAQSIIHENTWAVMAGVLVNPRYGHGGVGILSSALAFGGASGATEFSSSEIFDGSSWQILGALSQARHYIGGAGVRNAAVAFGGYNSGTSATFNTTEIFNGGNWSTAGNLNLARFGLAGAGIMNSALCFGGSSGVYNNKAESERFNGTAWYTTGNLLVAKRYVGGCGTQFSALCVGGNTGSYLATTELYNGVMGTWSAGSNINTARDGMAVAGTRRSAIAIGGYDGSVKSNTEKLLLDVWTIVGGLNTARTSLGAGGSSDITLAFGGSTGNAVDVTEKFYGIVNWEISIESTADANHEQTNTLRYTSPTNVNYTIFAKPMKLLYNDENDLANLGKSAYATNFDDLNSWPTSDIGRLISTRLFDKVI